MRGLSEKSVRVASSGVFVWSAVFNGLEVFGEVGIGCMISFFTILRYSTFWLLKTVNGNVLCMNMHSLYYEGKILGNFAVLMRKRNISCTYDRMLT